MDMDHKLEVGDVVFEVGRTGRVYRHRPGTITSIRDNGRCYVKWKRKQYAEFRHIDYLTLAYVTRKHLEEQHTID